MTQAAYSALVGRMSAQQIVCQKDLASARSHDVEKILPEEVLHSRPCGGIGYQVVPSRARPELMQVRVSAEHWGSGRRVRSILEVFEAAVEKQRSAVSIEKDGRKRVIVLIDNQLALRRF